MGGQVLGLDSILFPLDPPIIFGPVHNHNMHHPSTFAYIHRRNLTARQQYFRTQATKWWNQLPNTLFVKEFTSILHHHLLSNF